MDSGILYSGLDGEAMLLELEKMEELWRGI
jgi:hypothetical protein